jgi:hypothetical protein
MAAEKQAKEGQPQTLTQYNCLLFTVLPAPRKPVSTVTGMRLSDGGAFAVVVEDLVFFLLFGMVKNGTRQGSRVLGCSKL